MVTDPHRKQVETGGGGSSPAGDLARETVLGLDNIALDLPIAGLGSRVLSAAIDYFVLFLLLLLGLAVAITTVALSGGGGGWVVAFFIVLYFLIEWGYFAGFEILARGRTLGKMATRLRVVGREGGASGTSALLLRNLVRIVDVLVGIPLIASDPLARRLGDRVAGTLVVHDRRGETELTLGRIPGGWGAREVTVVESYLRRARDMDELQARNLGRRLLALVERDAPELVAAVEDRGDPVKALRQALDVRHGEPG